MTLYSTNIPENSKHSETGTTPETDEVAPTKEEFVDLARQLRLGVDHNHVNELLDSHTRGLTVDELIGMSEQITTIEADTRKTNDSCKLDKCLGSMEKGLQIL
ncbi:hypothetical protein AVEN_48671-1 [Araneus ventricosus]|uniref:Uncharacterized protein n=1 Tax=Araneus ventricosus TaxID=182803 RepID=A0A4Y2QKL4_ARAVE|nr:hypothetical protein AVEN_100982-1 [Araneus ventricosus]GBN63882.1 hypothetical protein AVEN_48671-1 [Araneus ventricosus]